MSGCLPIDDLLGPLVKALESQRAVVVEAPPGAGKTTRVPRALLEAGFARAGQIWVTEPRRVAARLAAAFVAQELGEEIGGRVGYSVRFEERVSRATQLRYATEGVLLRRLSAEGDARGVSAVVLDEFHERHLSTDLLLMLLRRELERQPELRLVVMSATLDGEAVSRYLGDCPRLRCEGRAFPLELRHEGMPDDRPLELRVASAVKETLRSDGGDVLVFLPGTAEIRRAAASLAAFCDEREVALLELHGEMPLDAQARAIARGPRRKVVLATNVAESSITVEGVTVVIDSGLARVAVHSPWTGRQSLEVQPVAQASAIQRAGRAGRTQPGRVLRLYTEANFKTRPAQDKPEIQRLDLAEPLLLLHASGCSTASEAWLDPPAPAVLDAAQKLLERLGLARGDELTPLGRRALLLPLPPRLSCVALEGERLGDADRASLAAALLGERDPRERKGSAAPDLLGAECDVDQLIELYRLADAERFSRGALRRLGLAPARISAVQRSYEQIRRALGSSRRGQARRGAAEPPRQRELSLALLAGFPDRVARRRQPESRELILATGQVATLAEESAVRRSPLLLALDVDDRKGAVYGAARGVKHAPRQTTRVRLAAPLEAEWLLDHAAHELSERDELSWDAERERALLTSQLCWGAVVLDESQRPAPPGPGTAALVERAALAQQANLFGKNDAALGLLARAELLARHAPGKGFERVAELGVRGLLAAACRGVSSLDELRALDLAQLLDAELSPEQRSELLREAPQWVQLARGRRVHVNYVAGQTPWIASRLQDFFGMREGPRIASGRIPLTLHLLAPNQRAVQVTTDLAGFWERHYPRVRRELMRRYPKHAWPEDGRAPGT